MKRWRCTVCGYIHNGDTPPDKCPNCSSPREKFVEIDEKLSYGDDVDVNQFFGDYSALSPFLYNLPVKHRVPLHKHPTTDELFFVLKGRIRFKVGDNEFVAVKGDLVQGKMDIPHTFENIGDEPAAFLSVKAPKPVDLEILGEG